MTDILSFTWSDALREYLLHKEASFAPKTVRYHKVQLSGIAEWASREEILFHQFGKRHLDRYLIERANAGKSQLTLHHDAICAKAFFHWCARENLIERSPLVEYQIRRAPTPPKHMPADEEMQKLLVAVHDYWNPRLNADVRYNPPPKRAFHRDRNYAVILGLLDSAARIGEMLSFKVNDYQPSERRITIRESKGRESRELPVSAEWADALTVWMKVRAKVMSQVPKEEDEGWLFIAETGGRLDEGRFLKALKSYRRFAGISGEITLHSLRRYSLNKLSKVDILGAQRIAGHKETKTTLIYTRIDPDHVRDVHARAGVVKGIVTNRRYEENKRKRLI